MTTFSQVVDEITTETLRLDMRATIAGYLNQTIREMHIDPKSAMPVFYPDNRQEVSVTLSGMAAADNVLVWPIPSSAVFQSLEAAYYRAYRKYAVEKKPSIARNPNNGDPNAQYYWYRSGINFCFANPGPDGQIVDLSWFEYPKTLAYFADNLNPAKYDPATGTYTILSGYTQTQALALTENWLLTRHSETLKEGLRAKVYKRLADLERARLAYSQFETAKAGIIATESMSFAPVYNR